MEYISICICLETKLLHLNEFDQFRDHVIDAPSEVYIGTLDLNSILVKTRRIYIHPFKSYKENGQTDRRTDNTDIGIKCSLKSHLIKRVAVYKQFFQYPFTLR